MSTLSYREYLNILKGPSTHKKVFKSMLLAAFIGTFFLLGVLSASFFYYKKSVEPQIVAADFFQNTSAGFISTKQSLVDVLNTFQVAGEKVSVVDNLQNSQNAQKGYLIDLEDKQKLLEKIQLASQNIQFQKAQLQKIVTPTAFLNLKADLVSYYTDSAALLYKTQKNHQFFKDMLLVLGPDFYLPILSDDSVWKSQDPQKVLTYYEDKKAKVRDTLTNIGKISPPDEFKSYYNDEVAYLELFASLSTDISSVLRSKQEQKPDQAQPLEVAYQKLTDAKSQNSEIAARLLSEKQRLLVLNENLDKFASIRLQANSLESRIKDESAKYENSKSPLEPIVKYFHSALTRS